MGLLKLCLSPLEHKVATETLNTYAALWGDRVDEVARCIEKKRAKALRKAARDREATADDEGVCKVIVPVSCL